MNIREWLKKTYREQSLGDIKITKTRPRLVCTDGFSMLVQAGRFHYCEPREDLPDCDYTKVEVAYPSEPEKLITEYAENTADLTKSVYGWVPIEIVENVIEKHGGIKVEDKP